MPYLSCDSFTFGKTGVGEEAGVGEEEGAGGSVL